MLTMLDAAKSRGNDVTVGLIEEGQKLSPEITTLMGRPVAGTTYKNLIRTARPTGAFRSVNNGSDIVTSSWTQRLVSCFFWDAQMQADVAAAASWEGGADEWKDLEAAGAIEGKLQSIGSQVWYGTAAGADGFQGLGQGIGAISDGYVVSAGGSTGGAMASAYLVSNTFKGVHFVFGGNGELPMDEEWRLQQVTGLNGKPLTAWVNSMHGWIGLQYNPGAAVRIANIGSANPLTDALVAEARAKLGASHKTGLKLFMNGTTILGLQKSRSATSNRIGKDGAIFAEMPTESNGIPIIETDNLLSTEAVVS